MSIHRCGYKCTDSKSSDPNSDFQKIVKPDIYYKINSTHSKSIIYTIFSIVN